MKEVKKKGKREIDPLLWICCILQDKQLVYPMDIFCTSHVLWL